MIDPPRVPGTPSRYQAHDMVFGRDGEMQALDRLIQRLAAGAGGAVWVQGEPGIGKTTLVSVAAETARRAGCQCHLATASELLPVFPLQILLEALQIRQRTADPARARLARLLDGDASMLSAPQDTTAAVAEQILALVDRLCAAGPVVLVLDDAQWADEATLGVLLQLVGMVRQNRLLLITTARPVPQRSELDLLRRRLADSGGLDLDLGPLPPLAITDLATRVLGAPPTPALHEQLAEAGGNPLYLREILDALRREDRVRVAAGAADLAGGAVPFPGSLHAAIRGRLSFLATTTIAVLRLAALIGPAFSIAELSVVSNRPPTELIPEVDEAVRAGVLIESGEQLLFRHNLIHQTLYQAMPLSLRTALHQQAAHALAESGARIERVTEQLIASPAVESWMVGWVDRNAPSLTYRAPRLTADLLTRIHTGIPPGGASRERIEAHLATALFLLRDSERAEQVATHLLAHTGDSDIIGWMAWLLSELHQISGRYERAAEVTDEALRRDGLPPLWAARIQAVRAMALLFLGGRDAEARATAVQAERDAAHIGDRRTLCLALHVQGRVHGWRDHDDAAALVVIDRALAALGEEPESAELRLRLLRDQANYMCNLGRMADAERLLALAGAAAEGAGAPRLATVRIQKAEVYFHLGRWDECGAELDGLDDVSLTVTGTTVYQGLSALMAVHQDERDRVADLLGGTGDAVLTMGESLRHYAVYGLVAWALSAEADGDLKEASARMSLAFDADSTGRFPVLIAVGASWFPEVVRLALAIGDEDAARKATEAAESAVERGRPEHLAAAHHCRGLVRNDPDETQAAAGVLAGMGFQPFRARALENTAVLRARAGDLTEGRRLYHDAVSIYAELDAAWDITRAAARLRRYGIRRGVRGPRRRPSSGWQALTPTELRVAQLVASGASNPDIATQLFLSRRTVETHVSHILSKLNARSRVDIARRAALAG
jgi:DNA-binding CsgD family transcriptional regulator/tetratricopeptide (TPR) repeat protein